MRSVHETIVPTSVSPSTKYCTPWPINQLAIKAPKAPEVCRERVLRVCTSSQPLAGMPPSFFNKGPLSRLREQPVDVRTDASFVEADGLVEVCEIRDAREGPDRLASGVDQLKSVLIAGTGEREETQAAPAYPPSESKALRVVLSFVHVLGRGCHRVDDADSRARLTARPGDAPFSRQLDELEDRLGPTAWVSRRWVYTSHWRSLQSCSRMPVRNANSLYTSSAAASSRLPFRRAATSFRTRRTVFARPERYHPTLPSNVRRVTSTSGSWR